MQVMDRNMKALTSILEHKFSQIQKAHDLLKAGVEKRELSSQRMRFATEQQTNAYFNRCAAPAHAWQPTPLSIQPSVNGFNYGLQHACLLD